MLLHDLWRGEYARATGPMEAIRQHSTDTGLARIAMAFMESVYQWLTGDARLASSVARQGLDLSSRTGIHVLDHVLLPQPIYAALTMGDSEAARPWLDRMAVGIERQRRLDFGHYHFLAGWERLESGDEEAALRHVRLSLRAAIRMGTPFPEGLNRVATAHVLAARGSRRAARDARIVWVDAWAFERLLGLAEADGHDGKRDEAALAGERCMRLYHGAFLDGDDTEPWTAAMRERLRGKFLRCASQAGHRLERAGEWMRAAECGLDADGTAEELSQRLMLSYLRVGRRADALKVYRRCRLALASALAVGPSPDTERIRRMLDD